MSNRLIGYQSGQGFLYDLSGASKMLFFILVSVACMATYCSSIFQRSLLPFYFS